MNMICCCMDHQIQHFFLDVFRLVTVSLNIKAFMCVISVCLNKIKYVSVVAQLLSLY